MELLLRTPEGVVLRDGRPFGEEGLIESGTHDLPFPQTLAGSVRTALGLRKNAAFFEADENIKKALDWSVARQRMTLLTSGKWQNLWPVPADLFFIDENKSSGALPKPLLPKMERSVKSEASDFGNADWLFPVYETREKPSSNKPCFLTQEAILDYLSGRDVTDRYGISAPLSDRYLHTAISPETSTSDPGKLYRTITNLMTVHDNKTPQELGIAMSLQGIDVSEDSLPECFYLGGERHVAFKDNHSPAWPKPPAVENTSFAKIILATPGAFGQWAPDWLLESRGDWRCIPGNKNLKLRLRAAFVPRYVNVSGWDYAKRQPKPTRRLVPAGSVYVVELQTPKAFSELIVTLWGESLCRNSDGTTNQDGRDGYGTCLIGTGVRFGENV